MFNTTAGVDSRPPRSRMAHCMRKQQTPGAPVMRICVCVIGSLAPGVVQSSAAALFVRYLSRNDIVCVDLHWLLGSRVDTYCVSGPHKPGRRLRLDSDWNLAMRMSKDGVG